MRGTNSTYAHACVRFNELVAKMLFCRFSEPTQLIKRKVCQKEHVA
jgi:hypothetical protein